MTRIAERSTRLVIESSDEIRNNGSYRAVTAELKPRTVSVRLKGEKTSYDISWGAIWEMAVKASVEAKIREAKAKKKAATR